MRPQQQGGFQVSSTQVSAGGTVTVTGQPGETVFILVPGERARPLRLDQRGRAKVKAPAQGGEFAITDFKFPRPTERVITVTSTMR